MRRIFIDMDGVIVDFDRFKIENKLTSEEVKKNKDSYFKMPPIKNAIESVKKLIELEYDIWIATKPPTAVPHAYSDKVKWILKYLPELESKIVITHNKGFLGTEWDYLIDDRPHKADCYSFKGKLLTFGNGYWDWGSIVSFFSGEAVTTYASE